MWPYDDYDVVLWAVDGGPPIERSGQSAAEVRALLAAHGPLFVEVHADTPSLALSDFLVWRNSEGMARVRIDEHREHYGRDPARAALSGEVEGLPDGMGGWFTIPADDAVTTEQASAALECWLSDGRQSPSLVWD